MTYVNSVTLEALEVLDIGLERKRVSAPYMKLRGSLRKQAVNYSGWLAKKYTEVFDEMLDDAIIRGLEEWDPERGVEFSTYVYVPIRQHIRNELKRFDERMSHFVSWERLSADGKYDVARPSHKVKTETNNE